MLLGARQFFSKKKLPYDAEVEYLEATGDQWIDTGVVGNQNLTIDACFSYKDSSSTGVPFGSRVSHLSRALAMTSYDGSATYDLYLNYNTSSGYLSYRGNDVYAHSWNVHVQNGNSRLYKDGAVVSTNTTAVGSFTTPSTLLVLAINNNGNINKSNGIRVHSLRIESSVESERRDLVPVRKGSKGYMYDRVSGKLFGNKGTGYFTVGPDVVEVEYLESTETQWIDTGMKASDTTTVKTHAAWKYVSVENALLGVDNGSTFNGGFILEVSPLKKIRFVRGTKYVDSSVSPTADTFYDMEVGPSGLKVNGTLTAISATDAFTTTLNLPLFRWRRAPSTSYGVSVKIGQTKIYDGATLVRDFVPVRVGMEGAMMDRLTRKIYRNAGTGAFKIGADKKETPLMCNSYVKDGLVAMWDGIENAGWGIKDISSTKWVNLCSPTKNTFTVQNGKSSFTGKSFEVEKTYGERIGARYFSDVDWSNGGTLEVCSKIDAVENDSGTIFSVATGGMRNLTFGYNNPWNWKYCVYVEPIGSYPFRDGNFIGAGVAKTFSNSSRITVSDGTSTTANSMYRNGELVATGTTAFEYNPAYQTAIGASYSGSLQQIKAGFYNIRVYNRALTAEEIAWNCEIDRRRFNLA